MTLHRPWQLKKNRRGFSLLELIIAMAVTSVILGIVSLSLANVLTYNARNTNRMIAIKEVEYAIYHITLDAQMTQSVSGNLTAANGLTLKWIDWNGSLNNVTYNVVNGQLQRSYSVNRTQLSRTVVAAHLNSNRTSCVFSNQSLSFKITSTISGGSLLTSETRSFNVTPRCTPITINATSGPFAVSTNLLPESRDWCSLQPASGCLDRHDALYPVNKYRLSAGGADASVPAYTTAIATELKRWWPAG